MPNHASVNLKFPWDNRIDTIKTIIPVGEAPALRYFQYRLTLTDPDFETAAFHYR